MGKYEGPIYMQAQVFMVCVACVQARVWYGRYAGHMYARLACKHR